MKKSHVKADKQPKLRRQLKERLKETKECAMDLEISEGGPHG